MKWFPYNFLTNVGLPGISLGGICSEENTKEFIPDVPLDVFFGMATVTMSEKKVDKLISDLKKYLEKNYPTDTSEQEYYCFIIEKIKLDDEFYLNVISGEQDTVTLEEFMEATGLQYYFYGACDSDYDPIEGLYEAKEDNEILEELYEKYKKWLNVNVPVIPVGDPSSWQNHDSTDFALAYAKYFTIHEWN